MDVYEGPDVDEEGTSTKCGRRWNSGWLCCRKGARPEPIGLFLDNDCTALMPCCPWNDYTYSTYADRCVLLAFDFCFIWIAVLMSNPATYGQKLETAGSISDGVETELCSYIGVVKTIEDQFSQKGGNHAVGFILPGVGALFDFSGGFFLLEMLTVAIMDLGTGRLYLEGIFSKALPSTPKMGKFLWSRSPEVCGVCIGIYPACMAGTCCVSCCDPEKQFLGQNQWSNKGACFAYVCFMGFLALTMTIVALVNAPECVAAKVWETLVVLVVAWYVIQPIEIGTMSLCGFGQDTETLEKRQMEQEEWELEALEAELDAEDGNSKVTNPMDDDSGGNARGGGRQYKRQQMDRSSE